MGEPIYLGTITDATDIGLFDVPLDRPVEEIRATIDKANAEREAEKQRETKRLRELFCLDDRSRLRDPS